MYFKRNVCLILFAWLSSISLAQQPVSDIQYTVAMQPEEHYMNITLHYNRQADTIVFKMPVWSPGGYFFAHHARRVQNFSATTSTGEQLVSYPSGNSAWTVITNGQHSLIIQYRIACEHPSIDVPWVENDWGLIGPTGVFLYTDKDLHNPVTVEIKPVPTWKAPMATSLEQVPGKPHTFFAQDFDILYDSPILMGNLEWLGPVYIRQVPHYFIGNKIGAIDRSTFMNNLQKIIEAGVQVIGDIPYKDYKFLYIGNGPGGIEHLGSSVVSSRREDFLATPESRFRTYKLLAHEYFHNYNVKRIRPVELGPFDYAGPNYSRLLWFSEGVTEYYAYLLILRSGVADFSEVKRSMQNVIRNYENNTGHLYQSLADASFTVWTNSPFSKTKQQADSTIS